MGSWIYGMYRFIARNSEKSPVRVIVVYYKGNERKTEESFETKSIAIAEKIAILHKMFLGYCREKHSNLSTEDDTLIKTYCRGRYYYYIHELTEDSNGTDF